MIIESGPTKEEKTFVVLCHLGVFASFIMPLASIIVPLIIWLSKKNESDFIDDQAKEVLNFQLSLILIALILVSMLFTIVGAIPAIIGFIALGAISLIFPIIGAIKANDGIYFRYPISFKLIK